MSGRKADDEPQRPVRASHPARPAKPGTDHQIRAGSDLETPAKPASFGLAPGGVHVGVWITALIAFLILAAVVYFVIVNPYTAATNRYFADQGRRASPQMSRC